MKIFLTCFKHMNMNKMILLTLLCIAYLGAARGQKSYTQGFAPFDNSLVSDFNAIYNGCLEVAKGQTYLVTRTDSVEGIIEAEKSADGTGKNLILLSFRMKKYDMDVVGCFLTISKKGKVKENPEEISESFLADLRDKNFSTARFDKKFKE
jgi:hypothetical protein